MEKKLPKAKVLILIAVVAGLAGVIATLFIINSSREASKIAPGSNTEEAKNISVGKKEACLEDDQQAVSAVRADDVYLDDKKEFSKFDIAASQGLMDVPAGTNYEVTIQRYDGTLAQGTIAYEGAYGTYNYTIEKLEDEGDWRFVSMVACESL